MMMMIRRYVYYDCAPMKYEEQFQIFKYVISCTGKKKNRDINAINGALNYNATQDR